MTKTPRKVSVNWWFPSGGFPAGHCAPSAVLQHLLQRPAGLGSCSCTEQLVHQQMRLGSKSSTSLDSQLKHQETGGDLTSPEHD